MENYMENNAPVYPPCCRILLPGTRLVFLADSFVGPDHLPPYYILQVTIKNVSGI